MRLLLHLKRIGHLISQIQDISFGANKYSISLMIVIWLVLSGYLILTPDLSQAVVSPDYLKLSSFTEKINSPTSVAIGPQGRVYVANVHNDRVFIYTQQGQHLDTIKGLSSPLSVAVDDAGRVYVGNEKRGNVEVYDADFTFSHKLGFADDLFKQPNDIAIDAVSGNIYVADMKNNVVSIYDSEGNFIHNLGEPGSGDGQFKSPVSVVIDTNAEQIIVLDRTPSYTTLGGGGMGMSFGGTWSPGARFQFFSMDGTFLRSFDRYGADIGDLVRPQRFEVDDLGRLYVTDSLQNVVLVYDNTGSYLGAVYDLDNPLRTPLGLCLDRNNKLYVASNRSKRVEVFGIDEYTNMAVAPLNMVFTAREGESSSSVQTLTLSNTGRTTFSWNAITDAPWLALSDTQGVLDVSQQGEISVSADLNGLSPGEYTGTIRLLADAREVAIVSVSLTVQKAPVLSVTPSVLAFTTEEGRTPIAQTLTIANRGSLPLHWSLTADQSWIISKGFGGTLANANAGFDSVVVYPNVQSLEPGIYTGTITVSAIGAVSSPREIAVTLTVTERSEPPSKGKYKDTDRDGTPDYIETCYNDPNKLEPGICGCGIADVDENENDIIDCLEVEDKPFFFPIRTPDGRIIMIPL